MVSEMTPQVSHSLEYDCTIYRKRFVDCIKASPCVQDRGLSTYECVSLFREENPLLEAASSRRLVYSNHRVAGIDQPSHSMEEREAPSDNRGVGIISPNGFRPECALMFETYNICRQRKVRSPDVAFCPPSYCIRWTVSLTTVSVDDTKVPAAKRG